MQAVDREKRASGRPALVITILAFAHAAFYFAPDLYLPFDLKELFLLGYGLVLVDSSLIVFLAIKLLSRRPTE